MADMKPILIARFWSKVGVGRDSECWPWKGSLDRYGYGQFKGASGVSPARAHRVAYGLVKGDAAPGLVVRHLCGNRACCNPAHLSEGTQADNHGDREAHGRCQRQGGRFVAA